MENQQPLLSSYVTIDNNNHIKKANHLKLFIDGIKTVLVMVFVQFIFAGVNISYKTARLAGMDPSIVTCYRLSLAAIFTVPLAYVVERNKRPKLTLKVLIQAFCSGLFGATIGQNLNGKSITYTSATFATAIANLNPASTFILAVALRVEAFRWHTLGGKAKVFGTIVSIGGAMLVTFYKGPTINLFNSLLLNNNLAIGSNYMPLFGAFLALMGTCCLSIFLIIQRMATNEYPCPYSFTAITMVMSSIQSTVYAICVNRNWNDWELDSDAKFYTVLYMGIIGGGLLFPLMTWCVSLKGPVYVSSFNPLVLIIVAIVGSLFLDEKLHLGTVLGGALIISGLYVVLWGKQEEITTKVNQEAQQ